MSRTIYSVAGCTRCKITKRFMIEKGIDFEDVDIKAEGKDAFARFYRENRTKIFRDREGVEFPVFADGETVRQGAGVIIGHLTAGDGLDGCIGRSTLHGEWIDGFDISGGHPERADELIGVLSFLKRNRLKIQMYTDGGNPAVLERIVAGKLGDRMLMEVRGPAEMYVALADRDVPPRDLERSIRLATQFDEYRFFTVIAPVVRSGGRVDFMTPAEIALTARMIEAAARSKKEPYELRPFDPESTANEILKTVKPLPDGAMFKYRAAARRHQVLTEIKK